jgi:pilus assembly protein Flp/PilA
MPKGSTTNGEPQHYKGEKGMEKALKLLARIAKDEEGTALIEYSILLGVIAVVCVASAIAVGNWAGNKWQALCGALSITC